MKAGPSIDSKSAKNPATWWICALLVLAVFAAYCPVLFYAFTDYDDNDYVWQNPQVLNGLSLPGAAWAFTHFYASNWHPLTWLSHMLDVQLYGMNAGGHHATNVLFHAANTVLLFLWLKRATGAVWRSAAVAALFGLHPLHVESVAWVAERKDVLSTFFLLLSLGAYTRYAQGRRGVENAKSNFDFRSPSPAYSCALFFFALGLMSKPMVVTLPFVLLLLDYWPLNRTRNFKLLLVEKLPFFALSAASCVVTFFAQQGGNSVVAITVLPVAGRVENAVISYGLYLWKTAWPDNLIACYPMFYPIHMDRVIVPAIALSLISAGVFVFRRRRPYLVTGWLWYLGTLVPVIGLVQVGSASMADRYSYVPLTGIFIALVWLAAEIKLERPYRRLFLVVLATVVLAACLDLTAAQVRYWQDTETLSRHGLTVSADNPPMQVLLGNALLEQKKPEEAGRHFAEVVRIRPDIAAAQCDLAVALVAQGKLDEVVDTCRAAIKFIPREPKIHYILANTLSKQGKLPEAIAEYRAVLQIDPDHLFALNDLAWLLATTPDSRFRDGPEAVRLAEKACQLSNYEKTLVVGTLAAAYAEDGRFDDAVKTAQKAVAQARAGKNNALVKKNLELLGLYQLKKPYHEPASH
jgi:protein O-mannosyl-transferase